MVGMSNLPPGPPAESHMPDHERLGLYTSVASMAQSEVPQHHVPGVEWPEHVREVSQDYAVARPWGVCVGDGMTNPPGGDVASRTVCEAFAGAMDDYYQFGFIFAEGEGPVSMDNLTADQIPIVLRAAAERASNALLKVHEAERTAGTGRERAGTTLAVIAKLGGKIGVLNVGDTLILAAGQDREGAWAEFVSEDQSHDGTSDLYNFFGDVPPALNAVRVLDANPGDRYMAYTDGLSRNKPRQARIDPDRLAGELRAAPADGAAAGYMLGLPERLIAEDQAARRPRGYTNIPDDRTVGVVVVA
jgi:serine/threonine protein phosphatase PrpC